MKKWKLDIRSNLINVRNEFVSWVDTFTNQFIRQLKNIETQKDLSELGGPRLDSILRNMLEELRESYVRIMLAFSDFDKQTIKEKLEKIQETRNNI